MHAGGYAATGPKPRLHTPPQRRGETMEPEQLARLMEAWQAVLAQAHAMQARAQAMRAVTQETRRASQTLRRHARESRVQWVALWWAQRWLRSSRHPDN